MSGARVQGRKQCYLREMADYRDDSERRRARRTGEQSSQTYDKRNYHARNRDNGAVARANGEYRVRDRKAATRQQQAAQRSRPSYGATRGVERGTSRGHERPSRTSPQKPVVEAPQLSLPVIIALVLIVVALVAFGLTRLVSCGGSTKPRTGASSVIEEIEQTTAVEERYLPTPYIAEGGGIKLHSAVRADELTEVLIHNASYSYADALDTKLVEATNTEVMAAHGTGRKADDQPTGDEWLTGEFIRCFRSTNAGPRMSAIDCGGPVGATVYAPVSGTVVRVKDYKLYNNEAYPDVQVHIQPEGRPDLDVVLIHLENAVVQEGDQVVGGVTPLAQIRDVYAYIGDEMQLKDYTAAGDNGNHTHIQINDATNKEYHGLD